MKSQDAMQNNNINNNHNKKEVTSYENFLNIMDQITGGDTVDLNFAIIKFLRLRNHIKDTEFAIKHHFILENIDTIALNNIENIQRKMTINKLANIEPEIEQLNKLDEFWEELLGAESQVYEGE
jgi:hypothetical protein